MPQGSVLQFRYHRDWIAPEIFKQKFSNDKETATLIAYIDQSVPGKVPELVPCRFASIIESTIHGTTVSLLLQLREFALAEDLTKFNNEARTNSQGKLPTWQTGGGLKGFYWLEVSPELTAGTRSKRLEEWEKIVGQLVPLTDFKDESCFYTVEGVFPLASHSALSLKDGRYNLSPGREYELRVYHYYPKDPPRTSRLTLATATPWVAFTSNPVLDVDSRYDQKRVRFKTGKPDHTESVIISIMRGVLGGEAPNLDFDLAFSIRGVFWRTLGYGIILGLLLAGPQIVATLSNPNLPAENGALVCFVTIFLGLATGLFAAFGLKKNP